MAGFLWGSGGRRLTPDDIARERALAARMQQTDYSPIASPWQGLARVSENVLGALRERGADRASQANSGAEAEIVRALMNPGGGAPEPAPYTPAPMPSDGGNAPYFVGEAAALAPDAAASSAAAPAGVMSPSPAGAINPAVIQALTSPYVSDGVRQAAMLQYRQQAEQQQWLERQQWQQANPDPVQPTQTDRYIAEILDPATDPQRRQLLQAVVTRPQQVYNPQTNAMEWQYPGLGGGGGSAQEVPLDAPGWTPIDEGGPPPAGAGGFPW